MDIRKYSEVNDHDNIHIKTCEMQLKKCLEGNVYPDRLVLERRKAKSQWSKYSAKEAKYKTGNEGERKIWGNTKQRHARELQDRQRLVL